MPQLWRLTKIYMKTATLSLLLGYVLLVAKTRVSSKDHVKWIWARKKWHGLLVPLWATLRVAVTTPLLPYIFMANMIVLQQRKVELHKYGFSDTLCHPEQDKVCHNASPDITDLIVEF